jgi:hypothetical protein
MSTIYTLNGKVLKNAANDKWLIKAPVDPYNPLGLPPFTIRCKFTSGYTPTVGDSKTLVDAGDNVWDITKNSTNWSSLFQSNTNLLEVVGANTSSCTNMNRMFNSCSELTSVPLFDTSSCRNMTYMFSSSSKLTSVPLFDTSSCTNMSDMFNWCSKLTSVPLFDTSSCTNMSEMFRNCYNVQSGALALYQQASTQATPPASHTDCFYRCGRDTVTGAAELAQIPTSWGGTMA